MDDVYASLQKLRLKLSRSKTSNPITESPVLSPSSNSALTVPWEIILAIVRQTDDPSTLASFSLVCFDLLKVAGPLLWGDLRVDSYYKLACLFRETSPPPPTSSRFHPYVGLHLFKNLRFSLPPPTPTTRPFQQPGLALPIERFPNPKRLLTIDNLTLEWRSGEPINAQLHIFAHLNPRTFSQIFHPEKEDSFYEIVETEAIWHTMAFMDWTRLETSYSSGVLNSGRTFFPGMENAIRPIPFTGEMAFMDVPQHVFDFRRRGRGREEFDDERARRSGFDEKKPWIGFINEVFARGVRQTPGMADGGLEILVSEKEDEERVLEVFSGIGDAKQRRKCRVTLGVDYNIPGPQTLSA